MEEKTKFLVIGTVRTGTTWLSQLLHSHPDMLCMREPFHHDWKGRKDRHHLIWNDDDFFFHDRDRQKGFDTSSGRGTYERARDYLEEKVWTMPAPVVGWKGLYANVKRRQQLSGYLQSLGFELRTILLTRNPIRSHLSRFHARTLQQWEAGKFWHVKQRPMVDLNVDQVIEAIKRVEAANRAIHTWCSNILTVTYGALLSDHYNTMKRVLKFLGVRPWALQADCVKLQPGSLRDLIGNDEELHDQLPAEYKHYLEEEESL